MRLLIRMLSYLAVPILMGAFALLFFRLQPRRSTRKTPRQTLKTAFLKSNTKPAMLRSLLPIRPSLKWRSPMDLMSPFLRQSRILPNPLRSALMSGGGYGLPKTSTTKPAESIPMNRSAGFRFLKIPTATEPLTKKRHLQTN